jgi:hypothetical protein
MDSVREPDAERGLAAGGRAQQDDDAMTVFHDEKSPEMAEKRKKTRFSL